MSRHRLTGQRSRFCESAAVVATVLLVVGIVVMAFVATGCGAGQWSE